ADMRLCELGACVEEAPGEVAQREALPRLRQRVALAHAPEHALRLRVREAHHELLVDGDDPLVQPLEQQAEAVALALDVPERASQLAAHPVEALRERAELVAHAIAE